MEKQNVLDMVEKIDILRQTATQLREISGGMQAVERNVERMLACVRVLEIGITDIADILYGEDKDPA